MVLLAFCRSVFQRHALANIRRCLLTLFVLFRPAWRGLSYFLAPAGPGDKLAAETLHYRDDVKERATADAVVPTVA